jgi:hypothetical protein
LAGDIPGVVRGEKHRHGGNVLGIIASPGRDHRLVLFDDFFDRALLLDSGVLCSRVV